MNIEYTRRLEKIEAVLSAKLPASVDADWISLAFSAIPDAVRPVHLAPLVEPCRDLLLRGGKRWRPLLMVLACEPASSMTTSKTMQTSAAASPQYISFTGRTPPSIAQPGSIFTPSPS